VDDAKTTAEYQPKHSVHVDITGTVLQRMNHVTLVPKGTGCEMEVVSNWSGWGHEDQGDFKKRVDETLVKAKAPGEPAKPAAVAAKPAGPGE
jgi:beta-mannanase